MKTTKIVLVEKEVTTWKCDFCETSTDHNSGCCGQRQIMTCMYCEKDGCHKHRTVFYEQYDDDYPLTIACQDCAPKITKAIEYAKQQAGYGAYLSDEINKVLANFDEYEMLYEHDFDEYVEYINNKDKNNEES